MPRQVRWNDDDLDALATVRAYLERQPGDGRRVSHADVLRYCVHRCASAVDRLNRRRNRRHNEGGKNGDQ